MKDLFAQDPQRFQHFSQQFEDMLVDYSKNILSQETLDLLLKLAEECGVKAATEKMFTGETINGTEGEAVLHVALRNRGGEGIMVDGQDVMPEVSAVLDRMQSFDRSHTRRNTTGYTGKPLTQVVNIGNRGLRSGARHGDGGPKAVLDRGAARFYFVSNIDGTHLAEVLKQVDPETTVFLVASKTFTTQGDDDQCPQCPAVVSGPGGTAGRCG